MPPPSLFILRCDRPGHGGYYELLQGEKQKAVALLPSLFDSDENEKAPKVVPFKALG